MNKQYKEVYTSIMDVAKTVSELQDQLQSKVDLANGAIHAHNDALAELQSSETKYDLLNKSISNYSDKLPNSYNEENHNTAIRIISEMEKYDGVISKVNDITANISKEITVNNEKINELQSHLDSLNSSNQELIDAINTINDFVESKLYSDARDALSMLNAIIENDASSNDSHSQDTSVVQNEALSSNMEKEKDDINVHAEICKNNAYELCPFLNGEHDIDDDKDLFYCDLCSYSHDCPMNNCDINIPCVNCEYMAICPLRGDSSGSEEENVELSEIVAEKINEDDDDSNMPNAFEEYEDEYEQKKHAVSNLIDLLLPSGGAREFNTCWQNAVGKYCGLSEANVRDLPYNIRTFVGTIKNLRTLLNSLSNGNSNTVKNIIDFYNTSYSNIIDMMLGDGIDDADRISINNADEKYDTNAVLELCNAVDQFTDDLINDDPACNTFELDMSGELKVISNIDIDDYNELFHEYHKDAIKYISDHKSELAKVLYSVNFIVFADNDINDSLKTLGYQEFNEDKYYTISIPAPVLYKYCALEEYNQGFECTKELFNSMNKSYNIDETAVRKYIISQILSAIPMEGMIYKTTMQSDRFSPEEPTSNDDIVDNMFIAVGYDEMKITNIIIRDELNKLDSFNMIVDNYIDEDNTKSLKQDICELVYQIWFNQICKLLFNNDESKVDDHKIMPNYNQALVIDSNPILNLHPALTKHVRPIEVLLATSMVYTNKLLDLNNKTDSSEYNITHTLGNLIMRIGSDHESNITSGQRLDIHTMYRYWLTAKGKIEEKE